MNMNNNLKPFYIYTEDENLYIKNINEETNKLASNVHCYCATIDDKQIINICCIDRDNKLIHMHYKNNIWVKRIICKDLTNIKLISDMKLYIINKDLNIFLIENNKPYSDLYNITHVYTQPRRSKVHRYNINNIVKDKEFIYKINIDKNNNIVFKYNTVEGRSQNLKSKIFNYRLKKWIESRK